MIAAVHGPGPVGAHDHLAHLPHFHFAVVVIDEPHVDARPHLAGPRAQIVADDLCFPNGSVITPDGRTLIVAETIGERLTAFDIRALQSQLLVAALACGQHCEQFAPVRFNVLWACGKGNPAEYGVLYFNVDQRAFGVGPLGVFDFHF